MRSAMSREMLLLLAILLPGAALAQIETKWSKVGTVLAYADFDGDQDLEIVSAFTESDRISIRDAHTGNSLYDLPAQWGSGFDVEVAVFDIDGDALQELLIWHDLAGGGERLGAFQHSGGYVQMWEADEVVGPGVFAFADLANDGRAYVAFHNSSHVQVFDPTDGMLEYSSLGEGVPQPIRSVSILDIDGEPRDEIVIVAGQSPQIATFVIEIAGSALVGEAPASSSLRSTPTFPNPFAEATEVRFDLARPGRVSVKVYDVAGRLVRLLHDGHLEAGTHRMRWDGRDAAGRVAESGVYYQELAVEGERISRKAIRAR